MSNLVLAALPDAVVVSTTGGGSGASRMRMLMSAIQEELESARAGAEAIATDLASALFVMRASSCSKPRILRSTASRSARTFFGELSG